MYIVDPSLCRLPAGKVHEEHNYLLYLMVVKMDLFSSCAFCSQNDPVRQVRLYVCQCIYREREL